MTGAAWLADWLAKPPPEESINPGVVGSVVVFALVVATGLLVWSFTRQLRKVNFDDGSEPSDPTPDDDGHPSGRQ